MKFFSGTNIGEIAAELAAVSSSRRTPMGSSDEDIWGWIASNEADLAANYANRARSYRDLSNVDGTLESHLFEKSQQIFETTKRVPNRRFKK